MSRLKPRQPPLASDLGCADCHTKGGYAPIRYSPVATGKLGKDIPAPPPERRLAVEPQLFPACVMRELPPQTWRPTCTMPQHYSFDCTTCHGHMAAF